MEVLLLEGPKHGEAIWIDNNTTTVFWIAEQGVGYHKYTDDGNDIFGYDRVFEYKGVVPFEKQTKQ